MFLIWVLVATIAWAVAEDIVGSYWPDEPGGRRHGPDEPAE